jgi:hypothetical protein
MIMHGDVVRNAQGLRNRGSSVLRQVRFSTDRPLLIVGHPYTAALAYRFACRFPNKMGGARTMLLGSFHLWKQKDFDMPDYCPARESR